MPSLIFANDPLQPWLFEREDSDDVLSALRQRYPTWPDNGRIFDLSGIYTDRAILSPQLIEGRDVTPHSEAAAERLRGMEGPLLVCVPPADLVTGLLIASIVLSLASAVAVLFLPKPPQARNEQATSPNNALAARSNQARPNARIPDIFGTVISTPDLISVPYSEFVNNLEVEHCFMCVGRGRFSIGDVRDGDTKISEISGAGVEVYAPGTSPNSGDAPQLRIGTAIDRPVLAVQKVNGVNGQTLRPPNANNVRGDGNIRFVAPDTIQINDSSTDFTKFFDTDDELSVTGASFGGQATYLYVQESARFYPDRTIEFDSYDPSQDFEVGQVVYLANATVTGVDANGAAITVDLSGTYSVNQVTETKIGFA